MNAANCITLSRIPLLFLAVLLMCFSKQIPCGATLCFAVYLVGALSDWLDGYLARKSATVSNFGKFMDALADKIFVIGLFVALLAFKIIPAWSIFFILIIIGREFIITGLRLVAAAKGIVLAAEKIGKHKTIVQIVAIGFFLLWKAMIDDLTFFHDGLVVFVRLTGFVLFFLATYMTIYSGYYYVNRYKYLFDEEAV